MKHPFYKSLVAAGAVAMAGLVACGDDSSSPNSPAQPPVSNACTGIVATQRVSVIDLGTAKLLVYPIDISGVGQVTLADGTPYGTYDGAFIYDLKGAQVMAAGYADMVNKCEATATVTPGGEVVPNSSASVPVTDPIPGTDPASSASVPSVDPVPGSSATTPVASSSSSEPVKPTGNPEEDIKKYPVASYTNLLAAGTTQKGWNSRYWDSCKPHCSWMDNVDTSSQAAYAAAGYTSRNCNINDIEIPTFTLSRGLERYWWGMEGVPSSCEVGAGGAFTCTDMAPIQVNDTLSYGFVAGPSNQGCGKCYHLQYDGSTNNGAATGNPDVKDTHLALKGKHMIVMASNIGHDVDAGTTQFDLLVPGGGVGIFNALSTQIGKAPEELGSNNGGILSYCMQKLGYWQVTKEQYQECVMDMCESVFDSTQWPHMNRGCKWLATFFEAADNPSFVWEEVECPQYLVDKYRTTLSLELETNVLYSEKWDNYKGGDFITTDACSRTPNAQNEYCDPEQLAADKAKSY